MQKTSWTKQSEVERKWHLVDAKDQILGRVATKIAALLIGKNKVNQVPSIDNGDFVVVINSADVKLTRGKESKKMYYSHTGFPGGFKEIRFDKLMERDETAPIRMAVEKMLPKNKLRSKMVTRLFIYSGKEHKHGAQNPQPFNLNNKTK